MRYLIVVESPQDAEKVRRVVVDVFGDEARVFVDPTEAADAAEAAQLRERARRIFVRDRVANRGTYSETEAMDAAEVDWPVMPTRYREEWEMMVRNGAEHAWVEGEGPQGRGGMTLESVAREGFVARAGREGVVRDEALRQWGAASELMREGWRRWAGTGGNRKLTA